MKPRLFYSDAEITAWAKANGYTCRGNLWRARDHYLTYRPVDGGLVLERRAYRTGAHMEDVT